MMNLSANVLSSASKARLRQPQLGMAFLGALSATVILSGFAPQAVQPVLDYVLGAPAHAQSSTEVKQYAKAAYEIEKLRQSKYAQAKKLMGGNVPGDVCRQQNIPGNVRSICEGFLSESAEIIKRNGLTAKRFNELTRQKANDPNLQRQIQQEILQLQKSASR